MTDEIERVALPEGPFMKGRTPDGKLGCYSCPHDYRFPATHIATTKLTSGEPGDAWPVCSGHMPYAMCAGWFPVTPVEEFAALTNTTDGEK
jgi:hypothetical protein